jgi:hypothetical protein
VATKLYLAGAVAAHYVRNLFAPGALSIEYPALGCAGAECVATGMPRALAGLVIVAIVVAAACATTLVAWRRGAAPPGRNELSWRAFTLAWSALWLLALSFVVGAHEPGADRHAYALLVAAAVALAAFVSRASVRMQRMLALAAVAWAAMLAVRTHDRVAIWRDDLTLWTSALESSSSSARVHHNLAAALAERGRFARAHRHLTTAVELDSTYWPALLGFAGIDCEKRRFAAARARMDEARALGATAEQLADVERRCAEVAGAR